MGGISRAGSRQDGSQILEKDIPSVQNRQDLSKIFKSHSHRELIYSYKVFCFVLFLFFGGGSGSSFCLFFILFCLLAMLLSLKGFSSLMRGRAQAMTVKDQIANTILPGNFLLLNLF